MADNARGIHVSPGVYTSENILTYATRSLGITTLGLVGETQRGPAFQPVRISNWNQFQDVFGGTSAEKFVGSQYPKYELPYIAKSYLTESNQLEVCRVLGLSGYNAGPAWMITATSNGKKYVVAVIRSRGDYDAYSVHKGANACNCSANEYDKLTYDVGTIDFDVTDNYCDYAKHSFGDALQIKPYLPFALSETCESAKITSGSQSQTIGVQASDYGHFKLVGITGKIKSTDAKAELSNAIASGNVSGYSSLGYFEYSVSLNPTDKDYILKVLGTNPQDGTAPIYVESLYDAAFQDMVEKGEITTIDSELAFYDNYNIKDFCQLSPINDILTLKEEELTRKYVGARFLCVENGYTTCHKYDYSGKTLITVSGAAQSEATEVGKIYTVRQFTDSGRTRHYYYTSIDETTIPSDISGSARSIILDVLNSDEKNASEEFSGRVATLVENLSDGYYYKKATDGTIAKVTLDLNNYKSEYRFASTPWIVSNLKGDYNTAEVNRMFRFHTISDGNNSNNEIKISIVNIKPDEGTFDVIVRDINDTDASITKLEVFSKCNMIPGSSRYIGYLIGTYNGDYEAKSKYITVEINESTAARTSSPAGFLGYPMPIYNGMAIHETTSAETLTINKTAISAVTRPNIAYNTKFDDEIKHKRQYFGLSDITGVDVDLFTFKGNAAYATSAEDEVNYLTQGFHMDARISELQEEGSHLSVDGVEGYKFDTVTMASATDMYDEIPMIATEAEMTNSIYEYVDLRKFTVYFYGGFDGWDEYRDARTNTDDFKVTKYRGEYSKTSGKGYSFDKIRDTASYKLNTPNAITSDYYAYLSGIRQFANPEQIDINVFATPGIDILNNTLLVDETIDMIEEERADSVYVVTTPDKPSGANDYVDEMYEPDDVVSELEATEINSNYTCTYYPWVKYYDEENYQYINLPVTKDVVRNMALTDNTASPWYAPAGISRGSVACEGAHYVTTVNDEDVLYEGRINPVKTFATDGVKLWGQKNLQIEENQLNRIAVRRLLLRMRKLIAIACRGLVFEPNDNSTKASFISTVTPILDNIKANRGISDYKLQVKDSTETADRRELEATIFIKVINALEYISVSFTVTDEGVDFENI